MRKNAYLHKALLMADIKIATSIFRAWERTLEPFAMLNSQLTQKQMVWTFLFSTLIMYCTKYIITALYSLLEQISRSIISVVQLVSTMSY